MTVRRFGAGEGGRGELPAKRGQPKRVEPNVRGGGRNSSTFEEKLKRFLKESQERQSELKHNTTPKRGRGRRR